MEWIAQTLTIGGCLAGAVIWICKAMLEPQNVVIERINRALDRWNDIMDRQQSAIHALEVKIQELSDRSKSNTHRLDALEGKKV